MGHMIVHSVETLLTAFAKSFINRMYLCFHWQVHVANSSQIPDHCITYSLSDNSTEDYSQACDHTHDEQCDQCQALEAVLSDITGKVKQVVFPSTDDRDEALYLTESAITAIKNWKCHILRSANQDQARTDVLELLDEETVFIIADWAMKFVPMKYRESQADWFGKRGISWHISVVYRRVKGQLQWQAFIHIIQSCDQGSPAVVLIMEDVLKNLKRDYPEINTAYYRQDNAGCYHANETITSCPAISQSSGVKIASIDFCDPQGGKGAADRLAATCKSHVRRYINEGHDVTTADQLKEAITSHGGVQGVRVAAMQSINENQGMPQKIQGISKLNNFKFEETHKVRTWRAYGIGKGQLTALDKPDKGKPFSQLSSLVDLTVSKQL